MSFLVGIERSRHFQSNPRETPLVDYIRENCLSILDTISCRLEKVRRLGTSCSEEGRHVSGRDDWIHHSKLSLLGDAVLMAFPSHQVPPYQKRMKSGNPSSWKTLDVRYPVSVDPPDFLV